VLASLFRIIYRLSLSKIFVNFVSRYLSDEDGNPSRLKAGALSIPIIIIVIALSKLIKYKFG
jgi:hypothetical protein